MGLDVSISTAVEIGLFGDGDVDDVAVLEGESWPGSAGGSEAAGA
jgi:hypothetical protein